jgi:hypothetical protein
MSDVDFLGTLAPPSGGSLPITRAEYVMGAWGTVPDATARDAIPAGMRRQRMVVTLASTGVSYELVGGITNSDWAIKSFGGSGGGGMGFRFTYSTTTTDADPGAGIFRGNNATLSSVTTLYVNLAEYGGTDVTAWLDSFDDYGGTIKGVVRLSSQSDATKWIEYTVTGWTTATGYRKLTVVYKDGPGGLLTTAGDTFVAFDYLAGPQQYRAVATASARTGMPTSERTAGMLVRENDTGFLYVLASDLTTWVLADTSTVNQIISHASADAVGAALTLRKARGTETSPAAVNADDGLGTLTAQGHDGSAYYDAGRLSYLADAAGGTSKRTRAEQQLHDGTALVITESAVPYRVTTTDATLTVIKSIALAADSVLRVRYGIVGSQSASSNRAIRETSVTVRRSGSGDPVVVAYGDACPLFKDDATWGSDSEIGHQINTSTDALEIIVKGKASTTIVWRVDIVSGVR